MFIAKDKDNKRVSIDDVKSGEDYFCPFCGSPLVIKKGTIRIAHFAHVKDSVCDEILQNDMSEWHLAWQREFGLENAEKIIKIGADRFIADINIKNLVIEFQHSPINASDVKIRSIFYSMDRKSVVWLFDFSSSYDNGSILLHRKNSIKNWVFKWNRANKSVLEVNNERNYLFIQINRNMIVEVTWNLYDDKKDENTFKYFAGNVLTSDEFKQRVLKKIDWSWMPSEHPEKEFEYEIFDELKDMARKGMI